ncbi:MAG: restriction endonuclease subunit S, partial [Candidatus Aenigmarchaeota archaeon]|nr:restriction endonuclease subunit S [Candidatus Aenigmarchaeota archaeon]
IPLSLSEVAIGRQLMAIRSKKGNSAFLYQKLLTKLDFFKALAMGNMIPGISRKDILNTKIAYPCENNEAIKIADFLSSVDKKINQLKEKQKLLQQYKKGVMQQLFSQEIRFKDDGNDFPEWQEKPLGKIADKVNEKNRDETIKNVLTNSAKKGIVNQKDYFNKDIANENNLGGYYVVEKDDFVYNPRISELAPVGPIKRNNLGQGVMSPLYNVFRFKERQYLEFLEMFFSTTYWHRYMYGIANYGARHDRMNISMSDFFKLPVLLPSENEMKKIVAFVKALDKKVSAIALQLEQTQTFKKGLLQKMFV